MLQASASQAPITYRELVERYGDNMAYGVLLDLEKSAQLCNETMYLNEEERLDRMIEAMHKSAVA